MLRIKILTSLPHIYECPTVLQHGMRESLMPIIKENPDFFRTLALTASKILHKSHWAKVHNVCLTVVSFYREGHCCRKMHHLEAACGKDFGIHFLKLAILNRVRLYRVSLQNRVVYCCRDHGQWIRVVFSRRLHNIFPYSFDKLKIQFSSFRSPDTQNWSPTFDSYTPKRSLMFWKPGPICNCSAFQSMVHRVQENN